MIARIFIWAVIGDLIGMMLGAVLDGISMLTGGVIGFLAGGILGLLAETTMKARQKQGDNRMADGLSKLRLREEQLEVSKELVPTGEVAIHKEIVEEEQTITVPIRREEMVIEKKEAGSDHIEVTRIPLAEEHIDVVKKTVELAEVSISKQQIEEMQQISETVKREELCVETDGEVDVIEQQR